MKLHVFEEPRTPKKKKKKRNNLQHTLKDQRKTQGRLYILRLTRLGKGWMQKSQNEDTENESYMLRKSVVWANKQYPRHFVAGKEIQASKTYSQHYMPL